MARLIDADKINYHDHTECMGHGDFETVRTVTDKEIAEIPTEDAVEVERCKGCKKRDTNLCPLYHCVSPMITSMDDDFCSHGERKDNG